MTEADLWKLAAQPAIFAIAMLSFLKASWRVRLMAAVGAAPSQHPAPHRAGFLLSRSSVSASSRYLSAIRPNLSRSALKGESLAMFSALRWSWRSSDTREGRVIVKRNSDTAVGRWLQGKS